MIERHVKILNLLNKYKRIEVARLAELLDVTPVTIRKDLIALDKEGLLIRQHGYAEAITEKGIENRMTIHYATKLAIVNAAARLVSDGETVIVESGSTCALLAEQLSKNKRNVTIITNSMYCASYVRDVGTSRVIVLGGEYQAQTQEMVGPLVKVCAREFYVDKYFVGTHGFVPRLGFTCDDLQRSEAMRNISESAKHVIMLTDSSKFHVQSTVHQFAIDEIDHLITDDGIPDDIQRLFSDHHVQTTIISTPKD